MSLASVLSPEARLLLATAVQEDDAGIRGLLEEVDPDRLLRLAVWERSLPPLWWWLEPLVEGRWSGDVRGVFGRAARQRELFAVLLHWRLVEALGVLEEAGIDVLLLKGAALAHRGYALFTERPMGDLDLLVEPGTAERAWAALREHGWSWDAERYPAEPYETIHHLPPLTDARETGARLEVHFGVLPPGHAFRFGADDLRRGAAEVWIEGHRARVPRPVPHLLHLCLHFAWSHQLVRDAWRTFRDVDVLARIEDFDWRDVLAAARASGAERCCYWTLRLARELGGVAVPEDMLEELRPALPGPIRERLARHYALGLFPTEAGCPSVALRRLLWRLGVHPGGDDREPWPESTELAGGADDGSAGEGETRPGGWVERLRRHLRDRGVWGRYLREVVAPRPVKRRGETA